VNGVTWYDAAAYCNWLSHQEGIPKDQWCYEPNEKGEYADGMKMATNYLQRTGYRLPTEAEWEYACRAGADTAYSFGEPPDLLGKYAWFQANSLSKSHPVGALRPNDLGLFDQHGNAWEWCQDRYQERRTGGSEDQSSVEGKDNLRRVDAREGRVFRGGAFDYRASDLRSASRNGHVPTSRTDCIAFRPARTFR
jgi:formylglycine-generating enzyme required for sulfatase activity